jgi:hypothetical protein
MPPTTRLDAVTSAAIFFRDDGIGRVLAGIVR